MDVVRREKRNKYKDLVPILQEAPAVTERGFDVADVVVLGLDEHGHVPCSTLADLHRLAAHMESSQNGAAVAELIASLDELFLT